MKARLTTLSIIQLPSMFYGVLSMINDYWLEQLQALASKYNQLGINADINALSLNELWGLYLHLLRLANS
jgi:hypothetical protein